MERSRILDDLETTCSSLLAILSTNTPFPILSSSADTNTLIGIWKSSIMLVSDLSTRMTLTFKESEDPNDGKPYAEKMAQAVSMVTQAGRQVCIEMNAGPFLKNLIGSRTCLVISSVKTLTESLKLKKYEHNKIQQLTKIVWDNCKILENTSLDEKVAIANDIQQKSTLIKDALEELQQLEKKNLEKANSNEKEKPVEGKGDDEDDEDDEDDDEDDDELEELNEEEMKILPGVILLVKYAVMFTQRIEKLIGMTKASGDLKYTTWLFDVTEMVKRTSENIDDLLEGVYPPQDKMQISENFETLKRTLLSTVSLLKENPLSLEQNVSKLLGLIEEKVHAASI